MIWKDGLTSEAKWKIKLEKDLTWNRWFAWYPILIKVVGDHKIKCWLQYILRKKTWTYSNKKEEWYRTYEYKLEDNNG